MSERIRSIVAGLRKSLNRIVNPEVREIELPLEIAPEIKARAGTSTVHNAKPLTVAGRTREMSKTSVSFVVPFIRIGEHYLVGHGEQKRLKLQFELPNGKVRLTIIAEQFKMLQFHDSTPQYLIGGQIVQINEGDAERYNSFLSGKSTEAQTAVNLRHEAKKSAVSTFLSLF